MTKKLWIASAMVCLAMTSACATSENAGDLANSTRKFKAHSIIYTRAPQPTVSSKSFVTRIESSTRSNVRSLRFNNYISNPNKPDVVVTLAISSARAGLAIYDSSGAPLGNFPNGKALQDLVEFEDKTENGKTVVRWYLAEHKILSVFETYDAKGVLGYSENTFYLLD